MSVLNWNPTRSVNLESRSKPASQSRIAEQKERLVFDDHSANHSAKLIAMIRSRCRSAPGGKRLDAATPETNSHVKCDSRSMSKRHPYDLASTTSLHHHS